MDIQEKLKDLDNWQLEGDKKLKKEFDFKDFKEALAFTNQVGEIAEDENHHPNIFLTYGKVVVEQETHEGDGLTEKDFQVAQRIDQL